MNHKENFFRIVFSHFILFGFFHNVSHNLFQLNINISIRIGLRSRYRSAKEQKETIRGLKDGTVDIVVGTHRLLSDDVKFKDLGLVIIDEEQRFGVEDKEKLKVIKPGVDVLTMSATPIPRTLHMALPGMRDISTIATPPKERVAV